MDELSKIGVNGGNDLFGAGSYSVDGTDILTVTLSGTGGDLDLRVYLGDAAINDFIDTTASFDTDLTTTAAAYVTDYATMFAGAGITLTSSGAALIFSTTRDMLHIITANSTDDMAGAIVRTGTRLPHMIASAVINVDNTVLSGAVMRVDKGYTKNLYNRIMGTALLKDALVIFEYPVRDITVGTSGGVFFNFIK